MNAFGWTVHLSHCDYLSGSDTAFPNAAFFSVNLVFPRGKKASDSWDTLTASDYSWGSLFFTVDEFTDNGLDVANLLNKLRVDGHTIDPSNTIDVLNSLVSKAGFYADLKEHQAGHQPTDVLKKLEGTYNKETTQYNLQKLNRIALKEFYSNLTPQWQMMDGIGTLGLLNKLLFPWEWTGGTGSAWHLFGCPAAGAGNVYDPIPIPCTTIVIASSPTTNPQSKPNQDSIRSALKSEIQYVTRNCPYPFALAADSDATDRKRSRQSFPHAIAPLTHLPASIASETLRMAMVIRVNDRNALNNYTKLTCAPELQIDATTCIPSRPNSQGGQATFSYNNSPTQNLKLSFISNEVTWPHVAQPISCGQALIKFGEQSQVILLAAVLKSCQPAMLLSDGLIQLGRKHLLTMDSVEADKKEAMQVLLSDPTFTGNIGAVLLSLLGCGWGSVNKPGLLPTRKMHILDVLPLTEASKQSAQNLIGLFPQSGLPNPNPFQNNVQQLLDCLTLRLKEQNENTLSKLMGKLAWPGFCTVEFEDKNALEVLGKKLGLANDFLNGLNMLLSDAGLFARVRQAFQSQAPSARLSAIKEAYDTQTNPTTLRILNRVAIEEFYSESPKEATKEAFLSALGALASALREERATLWKAWIVALADCYSGTPNKTLQQKIMGISLWPVAAAQNMTWGMWSSWGGPDKNALIEMQGATANACTNVIAGFISCEATSQTAVETLKVAIKSSISNYRKDDHKSPLDTGLQITFEDGNANDKEMRGYIVALRGGIKANPTEPTPSICDKNRTAWITDVAVKVGGDYVKDGASQVVYMPETVGSTEANGERVTELVYDGHPVNAQLEGVPVGVNGVDLDGTLSLDFSWEETKPLPLLCYGGWYQGAVASTDNAGVIRERDCRSSTNYGNCIEPNVAIDSAIDEHCNSAAWTQYLSRQKPKALSIAPSIPNATASDIERFFELSDETRVHTFLEKNASDRHEKKPRVAVLIPPKLYAGNIIRKTGALDYSSITYVIKPPRIDAKFIERWLNMDRLLLELGPTNRSDWLTPDIASLLGGNIDRQHMADLVSELISNTHWKYSGDDKNEIREKSVAYHPVVECIGIEVFRLRNNAYEFVGQNFCSVNGQRIVLDTSNGTSILKLNDKLKGSMITIEAKDATSDISVASIKNTSSGEEKFSVRIPPSETIKIRLYSLIHNSWFNTGSNKERFDPDMIGVSNNFVGYHAFGGEDIYVEALPNAEGLRLLDVSINAAAAGKISVNNNSAALEVPLQGDIKPDWLASFVGQQHDWCWSGHPADLPVNNTSLEKWVASLAGVGSFRDSFEHNLEVEFRNNANWSFSNASSVTLKRFDLARYRPARYLAATYSPRLRFRSWLNPAHISVKAIESEVFAVGNVIPGAMPFDQGGGYQRLPMPAFNRAVPLTMSLVSADKRGENGNLLLLDEALYRTDSLAHFGGVGERIELDLLETRVADISEIGFNPIFSAWKDLALKDKKLGIVTDLPFGLTYDQGFNGKVAQSGLVVRPTNSEGYWTMAKIRMRRYVLPETQVGGELDKAKWDGARHVWEGMLQTRKEGDEVVPEDFSIDFKLDPSGAAKPVSLTVGHVIYSGNKIPQPSNPAAGATIIYRWLCSWHKGIWGTGGEPTWRMQIVVQSRNHMEEWHDVPEQRVSCYSSIDWKPPIDPVVLSIAPHAGIRQPEWNVSRIAISDYTAPIWLTFIGSFRSCLDLPDKYRLVRNHTDRTWQLQKTDGKPKENFSDETHLALQPPPLVNTDWSRENPTFHLLQLFDPAPDVLRGASDASAGVLCGWAKSNGTGKFGCFDKGTNWDKLKTAKFAYLCTFQTTNTQEDLKGDQYQLDSFEEKIIPLMFPCDALEQTSEFKSRESYIRALPEFLGPMPIVDEDSI